MAQRLILIICWVIHHTSSGAKMWQNLSPQGYVLCGTQPPRCQFIYRSMSWNRLPFHLQSNKLQAAEQQQVIEYIYIEVVQNLWLKTGEWLIHPNILNKRLDVCINDTKKTLWKNGKYNGKCGFTVLTKMFEKTTNITVKMGHKENKITFPLKHVFLLTTTERPGFVNSKNANPVASCAGSQVVIIGPDMSGNLKVIGNDAIIEPFQQALEQDCMQVCMLLEGPYRGHSLIIHENSICRSHTEPVMWEDIVIL